MKLHELTLASIVVLLVSTLSPAVGAQAGCQIELISKTPSGSAGSAPSALAVVSADGKVIAFASTASNLVPGDLNGRTDVFVHDRTSGTMSLVSTSSAGVQGNDHSSFPAVSGDGRFVSFRSWATNLDPADTDPRPDVYLHDRVAGTTVLASIRTGPGLPQSQFGAFNSELSRDGRFVVFDCLDANVVPGDTNNAADVFVYDAWNATVERVSLGNAGEEGNHHSVEPSISADGRFVAFASQVTNWFPGNMHAYHQIYVRDRLAGMTVLASAKPDGSYTNSGGGGNPSLSADGSRVAFRYYGHELLPSLGGIHIGFWEIYVRDLVQQETLFVSVDYLGELPNHDSFYPKISGNGRFVVWESYASDLVPELTDGNADIFRRDLETGVTVLVSRGMGGAVPNGASFLPSVSEDGRTIAFDSAANNLAPGDFGFGLDVFVSECDEASPVVYCAGSRGGSGCKPRMGFTGLPSATAGSGFVLEGHDLFGGEVAMLLYGTHGAQATQIGWGYLCMSPPVRRLGQQPVGGAAGTCDGSLATDMNAWIAGGRDPALVAGQPVYSQVWCRDPANPQGGVLSDAVAFVVGR